MKHAILIAACGAISGCGTFPSKPQPSDIPLATVVQQVRADLKKVMQETPATDIPLTKVTLTLKVAAESEKSGEAGISGTSPVVSLKYSAQNTGSAENTVVLEFSGGSGVDLLTRKLPNQ